MEVENDATYADDDHPDEYEEGRKNEVPCVGYVALEPFARAVWLEDVDKDKREDGREDDQSYLIAFFNKVLRYVFAEIHV